MLEKKRKFLARKRGCKVEEIEIPETDIVIDLPAPKPMDRTEMNIDRNIATAKKAARDWDKEKVFLYYIINTINVIRTWTKFTVRRGLLPRKRIITKNNETEEKTISPHSTKNQPHLTKNNHNSHSTNNLIKSNKTMIILLIKEIGF